MSKLSVIFKPLLTYLLIFVMGVFIMLVAPVMFLYGLVGSWIIKVFGKGEK